MHCNQFYVCYNEITGYKLECLKIGLELKYGGIGK